MGEDGRGKKYRSCQKRESLSLQDILSTGRHLLDFSLITCPKSNLCTSVHSWNVTEDKYYLTHAKLKHDCTLAHCIFNWNTSVTVHEQERSSFPNPNNCQGQLKTPQSISVRIFLRGRQNRVKQIYGRKSLLTPLQPLSEFYRSKL